MLQQVMGHSSNNRVKEIFTGAKGSPLNFEAWEVLMINLAELSELDAAWFSSDIEYNK